MGRRRALLIRATAIGAAAVLAGCSGAQSARNAVTDGNLAVLPQPPVPAFEQLSAGANHWSEVSSPNQGKAWGNVLYAVSDIASTDVWAVGAYPIESQYLTGTLAEHWNGSSWSIVPTPPIAKPTARLNSIVSLATNEVWAGGYADNPSCLCGETIVDFWNGTSWSRLKTPTPGVAAYVNGITAVSPHELWAVGYEWPNQSYDQPLILQGDGTKWTSIPMGIYQYGQLYSVYAPAHNDAWAFGYYNNGTLLVLRWNGSRWTQQPFPSTAGEILSISGTSKDLWAAGGYYDGQNEYGLLYHWDGTQWKQVYIEGILQPSWYYAVSDRAPNDVWLVGFGSLANSHGNIPHITYHWNGTTWSDVVNPDQLGCCELLAVSARTSSDVWTVGMGGYFYKIKGTFTMHYGP